MPSEKIKHGLNDAEYELKFLLNRGYRKSVALNLVANKHLLNNDERNYLVRKIFSNEIITSRMDKIIDINQVKGKSVFIDGYNVLITVEIICSQEYDFLVLSNDGILRDVKAVFGGYKINPSTESAIKSIVDILSKKNPKSIEFLYDSPVSKSGQLAKLTGEIIEKSGLKGNAETKANVDHNLVERSKIPGWIVATSDGAVIDRIEKVLDIPYWICKNKGSI